MTDSAPGIDVSFVIPARDEELLLARTLQAIAAAAQANGVRYEIIVADDDSRDRTPQIAAEHGAQVVRVQLHNIGAVRNAGAAAAQGRILFFLDADTILPGPTLQAALTAIENGAIGGGATVAFEPGVTWVQRMLAGMFTFYWHRLSQWAAGCSIYVLRDKFLAVGGFDEKYFAAEERYLSDALKTQGKFVILREPVITSARKLRIYSTWHLVKIAGKAIFYQRWELTSRDGLEILYDAPREKS